MMQCPHSIYFFRNSVEDFGLIDDFKGDKMPEELLSDSLLVIENDGDYFRALQPYKTNALYADGADKQVEMGDYIKVISTIDDNYHYTFQYKIMGDGFMNTLRDWRIVPLGRPMVNPPEQKLHVVDIPGANGVLDMSNSLTKYPVFNNRTGSWNFAILCEETDTPNAYEKALNFLQGIDVKVVFEDDMKYYYKGKVKVENINPKSDGTHSEITLGYDLEPYKLSVNTSISDWAWDTFNFETDSIIQSVFKGIKIPPDNAWHEYDFSDYVDKMPVSPYIMVDVNVDGVVYAQLYNTDLGINWKDFTLNKGSNYFYELLFSSFTKESAVKMRFKYVPTYAILGSGDNDASVTIEFRSGRL